MSNRLKSRLKVLSIEELKQLARNEGLDEYSYPELLADFLIEDIEYEYLEEDVSRIEDSKAEMKSYLTKRKISFLFVISTIATSILIIIIPNVVSNPSVKFIVK